MKDNDTLFRKEMLDVFDLSKFSDDINRQVEKLYNKYNKNKQIQNIIKYMKHDKKFTKFQIFGTTDDITYFIILFSFDYFYLIHKCLQNLHKNNKITNENYDNICNKIKK
jgi:hypothetical protein